MDGTSAPQMAQAAPTRTFYGDLALLLLLLALAIGCRTWILTHTEVAARDSIGYIRYAYHLERASLADVFRNNLQHPGYPAAVWAISLPVRAFLPETPEPVRWQLAAQLASALASVLLVFPLYSLGKGLFGRAAGFGAVALFQCLPVSNRILSDGLSEATFLLVVALALIFAVQAWRRGAAGWFAASGVCCGLAYLTRPEGVVLVAALGLATLATRWGAERLPWRTVLTGGAALLGAALVVGGPYAAVIGHLTNKTTPQQLLRQADAGEADSQALATSGPVWASLTASWAIGHERGSLAWGLRALISEVVKGFFYVGWLPALLGLWWFRDRLRTPIGLAVLLLCLFHALVLWRLAVVGGYLSERHIQLLVMGGSLWAAAGLLAVGRHLAPKLRWLGPGLLAGLVVAGLVASARPLHANRAGHHAAGLWLADHAADSDDINDAYCWAHYFAGRVFTEGQPKPAAARRCFVVYERVDGPTERVRQQKGLRQWLPFDLPERPEYEQHSRIPFIIPEAQLRAVSGQVVYHWPENVAADAAKVKVYAVQLP